MSEVEGYRAGQVGEGEGGGGGESQLAEQEVGRIVSAKEVRNRGYGYWGRR